MNVVVVGAGFTGLSAAFELARAGASVTVLEAAESAGGLAGTFTVGTAQLEKFYHHWFTSDVAVTALVDDLGLRDGLIARQSSVGMYFANSFFRLSRPADLLRFSPLGPIDRLRMALLVPRAQRVRDWRSLENITARDWLLATCGRNVYEVVWEPLLRGKFGVLADEISAVWLWKKLCLRGGSRDRAGREQLLYFRGGFSALADKLGSAIERLGGRIQCGAGVSSIVSDGKSAVAVETQAGRVPC
ncbi:MAG TPA: FAD-dependent oxidoreductase, partial [Candidatus Baltobacteraceae bacterium]